MTLVSATMLKILQRYVISWVQPPILTISSNLAIVAKLGDPKCLQNLHLNSDVTSFSCLIQSRGR